MEHQTLTVAKGNQYDGQVGFQISSCNGLSCWGRMNGTVPVLRGPIVIDRAALTEITPIIEQVMADGVERSITIATRVGKPVQVRTSRPSPKWER